MVMAHSRIRAISGYGGKTFIQRSLLPAQGFQIFCRTAFRHGNLADILLHPINEFRHGHAIPDMSLLQIINLCLRLLRLFHNRRIHLVYDTVAVIEVINDRIIDLSFFQKHPLMVQLLHIGINLLIGTNCHPKPFQIGADLAGERLGIHKQKELPICHCRVGKDYRIMGNIVSPDIQQPHNIIQSGQNMNGCLHCLHFLTQFGNLLCRRPSRIPLFQHPDRLSRQPRTFLPDLTNQSLCISKRHIPALQALFQILTHPGTDHPSVKPQDPLLRKMLL